jgi:hypothetical protein
MIIHLSRWCSAFRIFFDPRILQSHFFFLPKCCYVDGKWNDIKSKKKKK